MLNTPGISGAQVMHTLAFWNQKVPAVKHQARVCSALNSQALPPGARKSQIAPKVLCPASLVAFAEHHCVEFLAFIDQPCSRVQWTKLNHSFCTEFEVLGGPVQVGCNSKPKAASDHAKFESADVLRRINELAQKFPKSRMVPQGAPVVNL